ncbi:superoxide dismutase [Aquisalibacillus elongatus]|uniref:superoxide dismutase n=1 Tax=Aquisalibacillus elongatus TaxID=485577 RepID=A0A3N5BKY9_9BACI|nr:superoxide dismutase [Aquisalibacillus elongatus]RPF55840.1 Fe-Mn family superoxide dismutase [Aquisalibacillus elongatus]
MSKVSLEQFLFEMEKWVSHLKDEWKKTQPNQIKSELSQSFGQGLDKLMKDVQYFKDHQEKFTADQAELLKSNAHLLVQEWQQLFKKREQSNNGIGIGQHTLPPLPYDYDALEPYISERIMTLHHDKHHQSYVDGLNKAEKEMEKSRKNNDYKLIKHWEREAAFNGAGHYLHTIFWNIMSPNGGGKPSGDLIRAIEQRFGNFNAFKKHFSEAAKNVEGSGWAILVYSPRSHHLEILQAEKHQNLTQWDVIPLLVLDVWEHAYYLQYENNRAKYVEEWWNVVNWDEVSNRYQKAKQLKWEAY